MNLPLEISQRVLNELASPDDHTAIRVILQAVANSSAFRLAGKRRKYVFERNNTIGAHVLEIPLSLWQHDLPSGVYRENLSLCHDLQTVTGTKVPLIYVMVPWLAKTPLGDPLPEKRTAKALRDYLAEVMQAPPHVVKQLDELLSKDLVSIEADVAAALAPKESDDDQAPGGNNEAPNTPPIPATGSRGPKPTSESPDAQRMREKRAREKAEREAKKTAAQPA